MSGAMPILRWPEERHLAPRQCGECGSRLLEIDAPYGDQVSGSIRCLMCARTLANLRAGWGQRASQPVVPIDEDPMLFCVDCGNCSGPRNALGPQRLRCKPCARERDRVLGRERSRVRYRERGR